MGARPGYVLRYVGTATPAHRPLVGVGTRRLAGQGIGVVRAHALRVMRDRHARTALRCRPDVYSRAADSCGRCVATRARPGGGGSQTATWWWTRAHARPHGGGGERSVAQRIAAAVPAVARPSAACSTLQRRLGDVGGVAQYRPAPRRRALSWGVLPVDGPAARFVRGAVGRGPATLRPWFISVTRSRREGSCGRTVVITSQHPEGLRLASAVHLAARLPLRTQLAHGHLATRSYPPPPPHSP